MSFPTLFITVTITFIFSDKLCLQEKLTKAYTENFQLSQQELISLYGNTSDAPVTLELFEVLDRIQQITSSCRILSQLGQQTLALDIIEQMTLYQVQ